MCSCPSHLDVGTYLFCYLAWAVSDSGDVGYKYMYIYIYPLDPSVCDGQLSRRLSQKYLACRHAMGPWKTNLQ